MCPKCNKHCKVSKIHSRSLGSCVRVNQTCPSCHFQRTWESQPRIKNIPAGNLLLSASILFSGSSPTQVLRVFRHMNIKRVTGRTFLNHQSMYLQPSVIQRWRDTQATLIQHLKDRGQPLILGGDGRADSPGHCAKYGVYTMMELTTFKIIDVQLVQVRKYIT